MLTLGAATYTKVLDLTDGWTMLSRSRPKEKQGQVYVHVRHQSWPDSQTGKRVEFGAGLYSVLQREAALAPAATNQLAKSFAAHMRGAGEVADAPKPGGACLAHLPMEYEWLAAQKVRLAQDGNKRASSSKPRSAAQKAQQAEALVVAARNGLDWAGALKAHLSIKVRCSRP